MPAAGCRMVKYETIYIKTTQRDAQYHIFNEFIEKDVKNPPETGNSYWGRGRRKGEVMVNLRYFNVLKDKCIHLLLAQLKISY